MVWGNYQTHNKRQKAHETVNISIELLISIALAIIIPLLGAIVAALWQIKATLNTFASTLAKAERSLDHNRDEHTKLIALVTNTEKSLTQRIELLEERIKIDN